MNLSRTTRHLLLYRRPLNITAATPSQQQCQRNPTPAISDILCFLPSKCPGMEIRGLVSLAMWVFHTFCDQILNWVKGQYLYSLGHVDGRTSIVSHPIHSSRGYVVYSISCDMSYCVLFDSYVFCMLMLWFRLGCTVSVSFFPHC